VDPAILSGLLAAFAYGGADFLTQIAGKYVGVWRASFYYYALGFVALSVWISCQPSGWQHAIQTPVSAWLISAGSGLALLAAVVFFTQGLIKGNIAVVVPIMASYGAVTTLLSLLTGEHFTVWVAVGIALTIAGACGAAIPAAGVRSLRFSPATVWACAATLAYGLGFWLQGFVVPAMGPILPVWAVYATGMLAMVMLRLVHVIELSIPRTWSLAVPGAGAAFLSVFAFLALTSGLATGRVAVVVVLSSLSSAVTVMLSRMIHHQRLAWHQWAAIALVVCGLAFMKY
jgi:drug/metabolite transporter (DMT)-like permease